MTQLQILPNQEKKSLKLYGRVAAGEHVAVTVTGGAEWIKPDDESEKQTLRLRVLFGPKQVALFENVTSAEAAADTSGQTVAAAWGTSGTGNSDATCDLNLNTIPADKYLKFGGNCLWILDDVVNHTLYGTGEMEVLPWPKRNGTDVPYNLDEYPDLVDELKECIRSVGTLVGDNEDKSAREIAAEVVEESASQVSVSDIAGGKRVTVVNGESTKTVDVANADGIRNIAQTVCLPMTTEGSTRVVGSAVAFMEGIGVAATKAVRFFISLVAKAGDLIYNSTTSRPAWKDAGDAVHDLAYKSEIPTSASAVGALEYEFPNGTFKAKYDSTTGKWGFVKQGAFYALPTGEGAMSGGTFALASDVSAKLDASNGTATNLKADGLKKAVVVDTGRMSVTYGQWTNVEVSPVTGSSTDWQPQDASFTLRILSDSTCGILAAGSTAPVVLGHAEAALPWTLTAVGYDAPVGSVAAVTETQWADVAPLASPAFTGTPTAPTPNAGDNSTKVATTAFVKTAVDGVQPDLDYVMRVDPETGDVYYTTPDDT